MRRAAGGLLLVALGAAHPAAGQADPTRQALLVAEDARNRSAAGTAPLVQALASADQAVVVQAIRGLGRFEQASLAPAILPFLADRRPAVRLTAAHALGQLGQDSAGVESIAAALRQAALTEADPKVAGALARSLGRLPYQRPETAALARSTILSLANQSRSFVLLLDAARALESFGRGPGRSLPKDGGLVTRLKTLAQLTSTSPEGARFAGGIRRAALAALTRLREADRATIAAALADSLPEVRRLAVLALADSLPIEGRADFLQQALADPAPMVRIEAIRAWGRQFQARDCRPLIRAVRDPAIRVSIEAIDQLGAGCPGLEVASRALWPLVDSLASTDRGQVGTIANWHRGAHALVSLARVDPDRARGVLSRAASHRTWQVRMYAARAAAIVKDGNRLLVLAEDPEDNVREAAVDGLRRVRGSGVPRIYLAQLQRNDHQLLITAARALEATPDRARAFSAVLAALERLTERKQETSRDARLALLDRLADFPGPDHPDSLAPFVTDFDPEVAARAAAILTRWTGRPWAADPHPLPRPPIDASQIARLAGARLRITMSEASGGGAFDILLDPDLAPVTVLRIVRLAQSGYYDGLTFHRVVPNFVIQGGSPKGNEYTGDGPYLRDEIGPRSHERGTVGISTRGRDTGDAQIFVNLVENLRLDFNYTVWGSVVAGMDVVDNILEGDVMDRVDLVPAQ